MSPVPESLVLRKRTQARCKKGKPPTTSSTAAPKSTAQAKTTTYGGSDNGGKGGLAWPNGDAFSLSEWKSDRVSQLYTWGPSLPSHCKSYGFNCIPMLWGDKQIGQFKSLVKGGYADTVMSFNEPNQSGQSDMSPEHGAQLWKTYIQHLKYEGYSLLAPATTSSPTGKTWLQKFFKACGGSCTFDGLASHWYDVGADKFISYMEDFHSTFGMQLWITEYACQNFNGGAQCSKQETTDFHRSVMEWMDKTDYIAHYFPFSVMTNLQGVNEDNKMMNDDGSPNSLGKMFLYGP